MSYNAEPVGKAKLYAPAGSIFQRMLLRKCSHFVARGCGVQTESGNLLKKKCFRDTFFLESSRPDKLSEELEAYRKILRVMEEPGYLISVYEEEEEYLRKLCGERHYLKMSFGYKDKEKGRSFITEGPLKGLENQIAKYDWHRRFAQLRILFPEKR